VSSSDLKSLEQNADVAKAASKYLAGQIAGQYHDSPNVVPDLGTQSHEFNLALIGALCISAQPVQADSSQTDQSAKKTAQAVATTGQTNKQTGATAASNGTTSVVEKTGITQMLGVAVEDGGITNDVSGNTMTLSTSLYGIATGAAYTLSRGTIQDTQEHYDACGFCTRLGFSATFNVTNTTDTLANASRKQVSQSQIKYSFFDTSARSTWVRDLYAGPDGTSLRKASQDLSNARSLVATILPMEKVDADINKILDANWTALKKALDATPAATSAALATQFLQYLDNSSSYQADLSSVLAVRVVTVNALNTDEAQQAYNTQLNAFETKVKNHIQGFNGDLTFGQQFPTTTTSSSGSSTTSASAMPSYLVAGLNLSWEPKTKDDPAPAPAGGAAADAKTKKTTPIDPMPSWTANFAGSFYPNPKTALNETTFRGATAALQAQWSLGSGPFVKDPNNKSQVTFDISAKYQRLQENQHQASKKADIALGNFKLEIPISSGVSFPLSVSFANAAEQVKETYVRGDFGISFDLDKLAALLQATKQ